MTRLPDFIIVGAAKSGTTTLYQWLGSVPGCVLPRTKEPNFFISSESGRGSGEADLSAYSRHFEAIPLGSITGEASVGYTRLDLADTAAERISSALPTIRLIYLMRHPVDRLRSHYRHELQRGRETRPPEIAFADPDSPYVTSSLYHQCIRPFRDRLHHDQLLLLRSEDLFSPDNPSAWTRVLSHIGLPITERPRERFNETASKRQFSKPLLKLWELGLADGRLSQRFPKGFRRLAYQALSRRGGRYHRWIEASEHCPVAPPSLERIWTDISQLENSLGSAYLWERPSTHGAPPPPPRSGSQ